MFLGGYSFLMGSTFLLPLSMIAIGSVFIYQCPAAPYIPIYILVGGSLGLMMQVLYICDHLKPLHRSRQSDASITSKTSSGLTFLTYLMLTWFIMGKLKFLGKKLEVIHVYATFTTFLRFSMGLSDLRTKLQQRKHALL